MSHKLLTLAQTCRERDVRTRQFGRAPASPSSSREITLVHNGGPSAGASGGGSPGDTPGASPVEQRRASPLFTHGDMGLSSSSPHAGL